MFFNDFGDVFTGVFAGKNEAAQATVRKEGHRERNDGHDDQGNQTTDTGVDWQEQNACADRGAVQAQHPHGVGFTPGTGRARSRRGNGAGLCSVHKYLRSEHVNLKLKAKLKVKTECRKSRWRHR
ncbi:hypothetical protein D3C72_1486210 [compost metagenome]